MKKYVITLVALLAFVFTSCEGYSADEILLFGNSDFEMRLGIEFDGGEYDVVMKKEGKRCDMLVDNNYTFVYDGGSWLIRSGNYEFPVSNDAFCDSLPQKMIDVIMTNILNAWKITAEEINGERVFLCDCISSNVLITVDAETKIPVEFSDDGFLATVKSYKPIVVQ